MPTSRSRTGLPPGVTVGATGPRLLAALVEVGPVWLLTGLAALFAFVLDGMLIAVICVVLALAWAVLVWAQRAGRAAGPGMRLDSLQIVGFRDGRPIGWGRVLLRWLVFTGLTITVVGLIALAVVMARHPRRQGWHDLAADAVVIRERPLAPPRPKSAVQQTTKPVQRTTKSTATRGVASAAAASSAPARPTSNPPAAVQQTTATETAAAGATATETTATPTTNQETTDEETTDEESTGEETAAELPVAEQVDDAEQDSAEKPDFEWSLRLDDGRDVGVDGLVLLGRNPQPRVGEEDATLIKVVDQTRTVSKSHLAVGVDASGLYVMDRGSTNGTTVTGPDGGQRPCPPGDLVDVTIGSVVSFGDHWLEVRRPGC